MSQCAVMSWNDPNRSILSAEIFGLFCQRFPRYQGGTWQFGSAKLFRASNFSYVPWRMAHDSHPNWWNRNVGRLFTQLAKKRNSQANRRSSVGFIVHSKRRSLHHGRSAPVDSRSCSGRHLRTWSCSHARGQARMTCYARSGKHSTIHTLESTLHTLHTVTLYIPYSRLCPPLPLTSNSTPHSLL